MTRFALALPAALALLPLGACATVPAGTQADGSAPDTMRCSEAGTASFVGQQATQETGAAIQRATGAEIFNWVGPDMMVTADYRPNRVRVSYDEQRRITRVKCG